MRKFVFLLVLLCGNHITTSQSPATITYDPTNALKLGSVLATLDDLKDLNERWQASAAFLSKLRDDAEEAKRFVRLMEVIICMTTETDLLLRASNGTMLCHREISFNLTLGKIEGINKRFGMILSGAINMSQADAIRSLKDLNDELEKAISGAQNFNLMLRQEFMRQLERDYVRDEKAIEEQHRIMTDQSTF
jgi:hypothetical protein